MARRLGEGRTGVERRELIEGVREVIGEGGGKGMSKTKINRGIQTVVYGAFGYVVGEEIDEGVKGGKVDLEEEEKGLRRLEREWGGVKER